VVAEFGASRIAWGSNFPASEGSLPGLLAEARSALAALPQRDRDWIFFRTAQSLYPALAGPEKKSRRAAAGPETKSIIPGSGSSNPRKKGAQVKKTLPVLFISLVFAADGFAQTPARDSHTSGQCQCRGHSHATMAAIVADARSSR